MVKFRVEHEKDKCIGCGACAAIDPENWEMDGDKSRLKGAKKEEGTGIEFKVVEEANLGGNREAADACPVPCIYVKEVKE